MITAPQIYAFIKAFPAFVDFLKTTYGDFIKLQIKTVENDNTKYINDLHTQIAKLKGAKTDEEIAIAIAAINSGR